MDALYISYNFKVSPIVPGNEILIAELGEVGFESFIENEEGFEAFIQQNDWNQNILDEIQLLKSDQFLISFTKEIIPQTNWNSEWEKNFDPIQVENEVSIRAPFHKNPQLKYDIVIEPKMSFGTGHHETTYMMVQHLMALDLKCKKVLDMGCGTGILAIFAALKEAKSIDAIDIDNWCYLNSIENVERNNCHNIQVFEGDASLLVNKKYDVIIANINRNILLHDITTYVDCLNEKGILLLSGFYKEDIPIIDKETTKFGLKLNATIQRNNWVALKYVN